MANSADHRQRAGEDGARQPFVVEGPEILHGTAAAAHDDQVQWPCAAGGLLIEGRERVDDGGGGVILPVRGRGRA